MSRQLLIVDDEADIRKNLCSYFKLKEFEVDAAENGVAALDILAVKHIDIIISDVKMPVMDGVELLREVRKQYPMIRVIMITGYVTLDNALSCMRHGADTCIFKPFQDLNELTDAVNASAKSLDMWQKNLRELLDMKRAGLEGDNGK
ncbi:MAG: response regulator [Promethearchaeota archaeon]